jgi:hypothetical protein
LENLNTLIGIGERSLPGGNRPRFHALTSSHFLGEKARATSRKQTGGVHGVAQFARMPPGGAIRGAKLLTGNAHYAHDAHVRGRICYRHAAHYWHSLADLVGCGGEGVAATLGAMSRVG